MKKIGEGDPVGFRRMFGRSYELPNGNEKTYDIVYVGDVACTVAITRDKQVVLVKQFRPGPQKYLLELPGGFIESWEGWVEGAARELLEETGYAGEMHYVSSRYMGAYLEGAKHTFLALDCDQVEVPHPDPDEYLDVFLMPLEDFREWVKDCNAIDVGSAYQALDLLEEL